MNIATLRSTTEQFINDFKVEVEVGGNLSIDSIPSGGYTIYDLSEDPRKSSTRNRSMRESMATS